MCAGPYSALSPMMAVDTICMLYITVSLYITELLHQYLLEPNYHTSECLRLFAQQKHGGKDGVSLQKHTVRQ